MFYTFCVGFIICEHVIYPHQKYEAWLLLLVGCLVAVLRETIAQAVWLLYVLFVWVCFCWPFNLRVLSASVFALGSRTNTHKFTWMVHRYIIEGFELYWYLEIMFYNSGPKRHDHRLHIWRKTMAMKWLYWWSLERDYYTAKQCPIPQATWERSKP